MEIKEIEILHSKKNMASYGFGKFFDEFLKIAFGTFVFFYYESELGLNVWITALGYIIFAIWNAFNDPFIGYLIDRPFKFTKKWGRRFPWVFIGGIPWIISYFLIFNPPSVDPQNGAWILFTWLVITTCIFDTFASLFNVSFYSIFPDKFRSDKERRKASGISTLVGTFGVALGAIIPPLFIKFGNLQSYIIAAGVVMMACALALSLAIPGCREDKERVVSFLIKYEKGLERESFYKTLKTSLKQKNFVVFIIMYVFYQSMASLLGASIPYLVRYVYRLEASAVALVMVGFLLGSIISIPLWMFIAQKTNNNRKTIRSAAIAITLFTAPLFFIEDYFILIIATTLWGIGLGGFWVMLGPIFADVIDESVVETGKREEGIYNGILTFFARTSIIIQAITIAIVHTLTGFVEGAETQSATAIVGIRIHFGLIPMIFMLISTIVLWKYYDLTPVKVKAIKEKLSQIGL